MCIDGLMPVDCAGTESKAVWDSQHGSYLQRDSEGAGISVAGVVLASVCIVLVLEILVMQGLLVWPDNPDVACAAGLIMFSGLV